MVLWARIITEQTRVTGGVVALAVVAWSVLLASAIRYRRRTPAGLRVLRLGERPRCPSRRQHSPARPARGQVAEDAEEAERPDGHGGHGEQGRLGPPAGGGGEAMAKARSTIIELIDRTVDGCRALATRWSRAACGGPLMPWVV